MGLLDGILSTVIGHLANRGNVGNPGGNSGGIDNPLGSVLGRAGGGIAASALVALAFRVLQQNGGIEGLIGKLRGAGLGQQAQSWVSTGDNLSIDPDDLRRVLGSSELAQLASQFGFSPEQASEGLAQVLPDVVDQMTPSGQVPDNDRDLISEALATLKPR